MIVLVTWLYLSSFILLFGAEFNSEIEHQTARDTTADARRQAARRRAAPGRPTMSPMDPQTKARKAGTGSETAAIGRSRGTRGACTVGPEGSMNTPSLCCRAPTNRAAALAGLQKVGMVSAALSTLGLSLLRKRGRAGAGAALLATAAGLSLLKRKD